MKLLAIEAATDACSVALMVDGETHADHRIAPREHARLILPMIDALLVDAGVGRRSLDGVVFGRGPGSFTGVRVAASVSQGIALGLDIGVIGVSSLAAIAQGCHREFGDEAVGVGFDARLNEVYWGAYLLDAGSGLMMPTTDERVCAPEAVTLGEGRNMSARFCLAGAGAERYPDLLSSALSLCTPAIRQQQFPRAVDILDLAMPRALSGDFDDAAAAVPVYLRDQVALTEAERAAARRI